MNQSRPMLTLSLAAILCCLTPTLCFSQALVETLTPTRPATSEPAITLSDAKPEPLSPWQVLIAGINERNPARRAEAVAALGTIGSNRRALSLMERALTDKDPSIRQLAATSLGEMHARASIPKLRMALADDSPEVSFAAAKALWLLGDRSGRHILLQVLSGERSSSAGMVKGGLEATKKKFQDPGKLAMAGAKEAASSLFGPAGWGFRVMDELRHDRSTSARAASAVLLGSDGTLDGLRELQDALSDKNWIVRAAAAQALGASRHHDQISNLRPLMQDDKPAVRYMAAASILRLSNGDSGDHAPPLKSEVRPALGPNGPFTSE